MPRSDRSSLQARARQASVAAAFDEVRFGRENMLDLRSSLPTAAEASHRSEQFLRERQVAGVDAVLIITGRGNQSAGGIAVVRPAVEKALTRLRRAGVVAEWREHTPGSFVVTPASLRALFEAPRRHREAPRAVVVDPAVLAGLTQGTRDLLRQLAIRSLHALSAPADETFVQDEMQRQFGVLSTAVGADPGREARLSAAARRALDEMDDLL